MTDLLILAVFWGLSLLFTIMGLTGSSKRALLIIFAGFMWLGITLAAIGSGGSATLSCAFCASGTTFTLDGVQIFWLSMVGILLLVMGFLRSLGKI